MLTILVLLSIILRDLVSDLPLCLRTVFRTLI
jgi:hypothetical protein